MKKLKWTAIGVATLLSGYVFATPKQPEIPVAVKDCQEALAPEGRPRVNLTVWRYYGQESYNSVHHMSLVMSEDGTHYHRALIGWANEHGDYAPLGSTSERQFSEKYLRYPNPLRAESASGGEGEVVFERLQYYSLKLMEKINYLDPGSRKNYVQNSRNLHPNQVTLFEATEALRESDLIAKYGRIPEGARRDARANAWADYQDMFDLSLLHDAFEEQSEPYVPPKRDPIYEVKVGVSWLVSGQDIGKTYAIPSEDEDLENKIDRSKYKFIWEVGRAGQAMSGAYEETLRASAYQAYWELLALGGKLEDAYVFAHSLDAVHTRLFRSKFGMKDFSKYSSRPSERCLVGPLAGFLKRYPPETYSEEVAEMVRNSKGKLSGLDAMRIIFHRRTGADTHLQVEGDGKFQLRNFNSGVEIPYEKRDLINHTGQQANSQAFYSYIPVAGVYQNDRAGILPLRDFLYSHRALEIAPERGYAGSAAELVARVMAHSQRSGHALHPHTRICVTTQSGALIHELRAMNPIDRWYVSRGHYVTMNGLGMFGGGMRTVAEPFHIESLCFLVGDLKSLPAVAAPLRASSEAERWLGDPEFFAP